ncbi:MAG TPA: hypothetical protein VFF52_30145 [Isosphaeraceae bacterium]|nr:hypothetical protein [Isosphaeraceae bacterium]
MAAESRQSVEQVIASLREKQVAAPSPSGSGSKAQQGWSGTQTQALAQQDREVIRVLDELGGR